MFNESVTLLYLQLLPMLLLFIYATAAPPAASSPAAAPAAPLLPLYNVKKDNAISFQLLAVIKVILHTGTKLSLNGSLTPLTCLVPVTIMSMLTPLRHLRQAQHSPYGSMNQCESGMLCHTVSNFNIPFGSL